MTSLPLPSSSESTSDTSPHPDKNSSDEDRQIQVCQNRTCLRSQSDRVLAALQTEAPANVNVFGSGCLGQCGSGPIVQVSPDNIWYCRVATQADVLEIVEQHLAQGKPVRRLLHPRIHAYYPPDLGE